MKISDMACRNAKPKAKPYKIFAGSGLYLEVRPNGRKYWRVKYYYLRKEKRLALGVYPETSLAMARQELQDIKQSLTDGNDPALVRLERKQLEALKAGQTLEDIAREWLTRHEKTWTVKTAFNIKRRLEIYVFPILGAFPISKLTPLMLLSCLQKIEEQKKHHTAEKVMGYLSQIFRYAVITGRAERDITSDLRGALQRYRKDHYAAIETEELPELLQALETNPARLYRQTILAIRLLLLTFVRTKELIQAEVSEFKFDLKEWHIPAERMKTRKPHIVPLSEQTTAIVKHLMAMNGNGKYLLPSLSRAGKTMSNCTILCGLNRLGFKGRMTGHGFRALAMTTIKERLGYRHEVVDRQLAHAHKSNVDRAYDRAKFLSERKVMMQAWADYIDTIRHKNATPKTERSTHACDINMQPKNMSNLNPTQPFRSFSYGTITYYS